MRLLFSLLFLGLLERKYPPAKPVNLNAAWAEQLKQVPGIGPVSADKSLKMRKPMAQK
jgi:DNA uptake protein ComE-like DNA-binding protein